MSGRARLAGRAGWLLVSAATAGALLPHHAVVGGSEGRLVGRPPAAGSCHYRYAIDRQALPDPACTPGALNPAVTQATIGSTICAAGWTATVRPPADVTNRFKFADLASYGQTGPASAYELDHLVPLELGGSSAAANLWVQPGASPNRKDQVENTLRRAVCAGRVSLAAARMAIATDWTTAEASLGLH